MSSKVFDKKTSPKIGRNSYTPKGFGHTKSQASLRVAPSNLTEKSFKGIGENLINFIANKIGKSRARQYSRSERYAQSIMNRYWRPRISNEAEILNILLDEKSCDSLQRRLEYPRTKEEKRIINLLIQLCDLLDGSIENVRVWMETPLAELGERTAASYLKEGKINVVESLVYFIEVGQPL